MKQIPLPVRSEDRYDVVMLSLMDVICRQMLTRAKPKSRRHNQLTALHSHLVKVDETFPGYLPDEFQGEAEKALVEIEKRIVELNQGGCDVV